MKTVLKSIAAATFWLTVLSSAQAATVNIAGYIPGFYNDSLHGRVGGILASVTGASGYGFINNPLAGALPFTFCVELSQGLTPTSSGYSVVDPATAYTGGPSNGWGPGAAGISANVDKLMAFAFSLLPASTHVGEDLASLQLALWNVIFDGDNSVSSGAFAADVLAPVSIVSQANALLNPLTGYATYAGQTSHYLVITDPFAQDLIVIPEPGSVALAGLALAGMLLTTRRKNLG